LAVSVYLDASVLVPLFVEDVFTARADAFLRQLSEPVIVSDFAAAEFASSVARKVRMRRLESSDAQAAFAAFDGWTADGVSRAETGAADLALATSFLRRLDLTLRAPDAINIALAVRLTAPLVTFDAAMKEAAERLGAPIAEA
jgi:predicted nucleic acid-binding protein